MLAFLKALILVPVALVVILLAVANRAPVTVSFDPFARDAPELAASVPLYGLVLAAVAVGIVIGGIGSWLAAAPSRRHGRVSRREAQRLRREADRMRAEMVAARGPALPAPRSAA